MGEATDIVQKEMYTFDDGGGRSLTLRPEGTAPVCRAYIEHGMHKLPQPVKLWYLSSFFRAEAPQRGRYRQFWQVGAEAIGSAAPETDAELIVLLAELLEAIGVKGVTLTLSSLGTPETRAEYREELRQYLHAHEQQLSPEVRNRIDLNPMRAFDASRSRDPRGDARRAQAAGPARARGRRALRRRCASCSTTPGSHYELDPTLVRGLDYYTRTVFEFSSDALGRAVRRRRRRALRPADRAARRAADAGLGLGRRRRADAAGGRRAAGPAPTSSTCSWRSPGHDGGRAAFGLAREARRRRAAAPSSSSPDGRCGASCRHADRIGARYVAIVGERGDVVEEHGVGRAARACRPHDVIPTILRGHRLS